MRTSLLHSLLILITLCAFVGQSFAYHMAAPATQQTNLTLAQHVVDDANHTDELDDCCDVECCEVDCICPENACSFSTYVANQLTWSTPLLNHRNLFLYSKQDLTAIVVSLYRPPIFTS